MRTCILLNVAHCVTKSEIIKVNKKKYSLHGGITTMCFKMKIKLCLGTHPTSCRSVDQTGESTDARGLTFITARKFASRGGRSIRNFQSWQL